MFSFTLPRVEGKKPPREGYAVGAHNGKAATRFQFPPSAWRETATSTLISWASLCFNSLRAKGDSPDHTSYFLVGRFQSPPPAWRETGGDGCGEHFRRVSIPSLRAEGDPPCQLHRPLSTGFNPLSPCGGETRERHKNRHGPWSFNPLPPCGGRQQNIPIYPFHIW